MTSKLDLAIEEFVEKLSEVIVATVNNSYNFYQDTGVDEDKEDWGGLKETVSNIVNEILSSSKDYVDGND